RFTNPDRTKTREQSEEVCGENEDENGGDDGEEFFRLLCITGDGVEEIKNSFDDRLHQILKTMGNHTARFSREDERVADQKCHVHPAHKKRIPDLERSDGEQVFRRKWRRSKS